MKQIKTYSTRNGFNDLSTLKEKKIKKNWGRRWIEHYVARSLLVIWKSINVWQSVIRVCNNTFEMCSIFLHSHRPLHFAHFIHLTWLHDALYRERAREIGTEQRKKWHSQFFLFSIWTMFTDARRWENVVMSMQIEQNKRDFIQVPKRITWHPIICCKIFRSSNEKKNIIRFWKLVFFHFFAL